jgi:hypothetical protein
VTAPGRNEPCPCSSGKKYKRCCLMKTWQDQEQKIADAKAAWKREEALVAAGDPEALKRRAAERVKRGKVMGVLTMMVGVAAGGIGRGGR